MFYAGLWHGTAIGLAAMSGIHVPEQGRPRRHQGRSRARARLRLFFCAVEC
jgi:hypothetical protein